MKQPRSSTTIFSPRRITPRWRPASNINSRARSSPSWMLPTFPNRTLFAAGGFCGGLFLGLILAAFLEYKDTALRTEQDVWAFTKLPTLAVIAYSGEIEPHTPKPSKLFRLKRLFGRKAPDEAL